MVASSVNRCQKHPRQDRPLRGASDTDAHPLGLLIQQQGAIARAFQTGDQSAGHRHPKPQRAGRHTLRDRRQICSQRAPVGELRKQPGDPGQRVADGPQWRRLWPESDDLVLPHLQRGQAGPQQLREAPHLSDRRTADLPMPSPAHRQTASYEHSPRCWSRHVVDWARFKPQRRPTPGDLRQRPPRRPIGRPEGQCPHPLPWRPRLPRRDHVGGRFVLDHMAQRLRGPPVCPKPVQRVGIVRAASEDSVWHRHKGVQVEWTGLAVTNPRDGKSMAARSSDAPLASQDPRAGGAASRWNRSSSIWSKSRCHGTVPTPRAAARRWARSSTGANQGGLQIGPSQKSERGSICSSPTRDLTTLLEQR